MPVRLCGEFQCDTEFVFSFGLMFSSSVLVKCNHQPVRGSRAMLHTWPRHNRGSAGGVALAARQQVSRYAFLGSRVCIVIKGRRATDCV